MRKFTLFAIAATIISLSVSQFSFAYQTRNVWIKGNERAVAELADRTENINADDSEGKTPLIYASQYNKAEVVNFLLQRGANPNIANPSSLTPLMFAAVHNTNADVLQALINKGANLNAQDSSGKTALIHAANFKENDRSSFIKILLENGANPFIQDKNQLTASAYAQNNIVLSNSPAKKLLAHYSDPAESPYFQKKLPTKDVHKPNPIATDPSENKNNVYVSNPPTTQNLATNTNVTDFSNAEIQTRPDIPTQPLGNALRPVNPPPVVLPPIVATPIPSPLPSNSLLRTMIEYLSAINHIWGAIGGIVITFFGVLIGKNQWKRSKLPSSPRGN